MRRILSHFLPFERPSQVCVLLFAIMLAAQAQTGVHSTLEEAYAELGFDPRAPGCSVVVLASDVHMNLDLNGVPAPVATTNLDHRMVRVINSMSPPPAKLLISGDVSSSLAPIPGGDARFDQPTFFNATNEMVYFLNSLKVLTNIHQTNILWIPGNHDVGAFESSADTFRTMFPEMPPYQTFEFAGIRWFLVNPGNFGTPDEAQKEWARGEFSKLHPDDTVIVMTHQPPFANPVAHRGMGLLLRELFEHRPSHWWLITGHDHARAQRTWRIGESKVAEINLGPATTNTFVGFSYDVGFAFLCLSNGVVGQIYYHYAGDHYRVWRQPEWDFPREYIPAFEGLPGLLWRRLKSGYGKTPEQTAADSIDSIEWWAYPKYLEWEMPLGAHGNEATHFVLAVAGLTTEPVFECSADHTNWVRLEVPAPINLAYAFPIPPEMRHLPKVHLRLRSEDGFGNNWVGGWGLLTTNGPGGFRYPKLEAVPDQMSYPGRSIAVPLKAISPYSPPDRLRFTLLSGPIGASVDPQSGIFAWTPATTQAAADYAVSVKVSDDGSPPAEATQQFSVRILPGGGPTLTMPSTTAGGGLRFGVAGDSGSFRVLYSTDEETWNVLCVTNGAPHRFEFVLDSAPTDPHTFYAVRQRQGDAMAIGPHPWPIAVPYLVDVQAPAAEFHVLRSTNLVDWASIATTNLPGSRFKIVDPGAQRWQTRAYKAQSTP